LIKCDKIYYECQSGKGGTAFLSHNINILGDDLIMETNNKTVDENEKERFIKVVNEYPIKTQKDFIKCYKKEYRQEIAQSSVSPKLKLYNIHKIYDKYTYVPTPPEEALLINILNQSCYHVSKVRQDYYQMVLKCKVGYEMTICHLLSKQFSEQYQALIPGYGSVLVICSYKKQINQIGKYVVKHNKQVPEKLITNEN